MTRLIVYRVNPGRVKDANLLGLVLQIIPE
jgi:hypothetical protein